jgi:hypothetical protein
MVLWMSFIICTSVMDQWIYSNRMLWLDPNIQLLFRQICTYPWMTHHMDNLP